MNKRLSIFLTGFMAVLLFVPSAAADRHRSEHPAVTTDPSLENPGDVLTAIHLCTQKASWHVVLKAGEPLTLELLTCPKDFHPQIFKDSDDDGWPWPIRHQVLLLERRSRWKIHVVSALYSELNFVRVEPGQIRGSNTDAVLWSYEIKCGSCHGGPEGILIWNNVDKRYSWNNSWLNEKPQIAAIDALLPDDYYVDEAGSLFWSEDRSSLYLRSAVYAASDAHCCPQGGSVSASVNIRDGRLALSDLRYHKPQ